MNEFLDKMSAVMEMPVEPRTKFRETEGWSSLKAFGILVTLENDFSKRMSLAEFSGFSTIGELAAACGIG